MEGGKKATILVVDDNPVNLSVLIDYLDECGFETLVARNGEGALEQTAVASPDLILLDVLMPGLDGFETCTRLKADEATKDIPVIFMTALSDTVDKVKGFSVGAADYVTKPFHQEEVLARINAHLTIMRQKRKLEELNSIKNRFLSLIALDMKYVFSTILGPSRLLAESFDMFSKNEVKSISKRLYRSAQNTITMLEKLLNITDIQCGIMELHPEYLNVYTHVKDSVIMYREQLKKKNISVRNEIDPDICVFADSAVLATVLQNLLSNAIRNTLQNGMVTFSAKEKEKMVEISVMDTGVGISEINIKKLFRIDETFKKVGVTGREQIGLGLVLCRELLTKSNGNIVVKSEEGRGTAFIFTLPKNA